MIYGDFTNLMFNPWLNRPDATVQQVAMFIERGLARCSREMRLPCQEGYCLGTPDTNGNLSSIPIPDDFIEAQRFVADGVALQMVTPEEFLRKRGDPGTYLGNTFAAYPTENVLTGAAPEMVTRIGGQFIFNPLPQGYVTLFYYQQFQDLVLPADTNALLAVSPEALMWAALSYAASFFRMDEQVEWEQRYQAERDLLKGQAEDADEGGGPVTVQSAYDGGYL